MLLLEGPELIPPPPLVLVDRDTLASVMRDLELPPPGGAWQAGLRPGLTLHAGRRAARLADVPGRRRSPVRGARRGPPTGSGDSERTVPRPVGRGPRRGRVRHPVPRVEPAVRHRADPRHPDLGGRRHLGHRRAGHAGRARARRRDRRAVVRPPATGGDPAGGAGRLARRASGRRRCSSSPCRWSWAWPRGSLAAYALVAWLGPSPHVEPSAIRGASSPDCSRIVAAAVTVGRVVAIRADADPSPHRGRAWLAAPPLGAAPRRGSPSSPTGASASGASPSAVGRR